jgi:DNA-binding CsgD family transcriptional regulator
VANPDDIGRAYVNLAEATLYCGDVRGALDVVHRGIVASDKVGLDRTYGRYIRDEGVQIAFDIGEWDEGYRLAEESLEFVGSSRLERVHTIARWAPLLVARGDARAPEYLAELRALMDGYPVEMQFNGPYRESQAEAALWNGDPDAALELIRTGLAEVENGRGRWYHRRLFRVAFRAAAEVAEVARARRDRERERAAIEIGSEIWTSLEPLIPTIRASDSEPAVEQADAELATIAAERSRIDGERASSAWRDAAARWRTRENPYLRAYCLWREAEGLLGDGDRGTASTVLAEAYGIATMLEAGPLSAAIDSLATRARLDLAAGDRTPVFDAAAPAADPFGLTRRERDVLPLLVKGRTNRQIADELFISENTAGVHVSNILGKLGASTRTEAAGIAAKLGLGVD